MQLVLKRVLVYLIAGCVCCALAAELCPVMAVTLPPESATAEEEPAPPEEIVPERQPGPPPEDPFRESANPQAREDMRQKREKRTIIIILAVMVLLCAYWLISGRLRQRLPRLK